ncbi:hypothetical protein BDR04DRAFT_1087834, partial [Suillus decipiens]
MSYDRVVRLGPKVTLKLKTSSPKTENSDSSYQSSVSACPPVEAPRNQKKRSRDARCEIDIPTIPSIPSSAIQPVRVIVPLRRKITTAMDGKSVVGHLQNNEASDHLSQDWEMSAPADPAGAPVPTQPPQLQGDWEMAS